MVAPGTGVGAFETVRVAPRWIRVTGAPAVRLSAEAGRGPPCAAAEGVLARDDPTRRGWLVSWCVSTHNRFTPKTTAATTTTTQKWVNPRLLLLLLLLLLVLKSVCCVLIHTELTPLLLLLVLLLLPRVQPRFSGGRACVRQGRGCVGTLLLCVAPHRSGSAEPHPELLLGSGCG